MPSTMHAAATRPFASAEPKDHCRPRARSATKMRESGVSSPDRTARGKERRRPGSAYSRPASLHAGTLATSATGRMRASTMRGQRVCPWLNSSPSLAK
jgi:hypothetical protein